MSTQQNQSVLSIKDKQMIGERQERKKCSTQG